MIWENTLMAYAAALVLGLAVGSFLNVVVARLPKMLEREWTHTARDYLKLPEREHAAPAWNLAVPRSHCFSCGNTLRWFDNIPVLSWLLLRGRCRSCQAAVSWRYPLLEGLTALAFCAVLWRFGSGEHTLWLWAFSAFVLAMVFIDAETQLLPDELTLPLLWLGLLFNSRVEWIALTESVWGAAAGYGGLWLLYHAHRLISGRQGMGYGDFKMAAAMGAWLGIWSLPLIILLAALGGCVFALLRGLGRQTAFAFGPFIAVGAWIVLLWQDELNAWLLHWFG